MLNRSTWISPSVPSRYDKGEQDEGDYINCPFTKEEYYTFVEALLQAQRIELRSFEDAIKSSVKAGHFFEGCLPVEIIAERGVNSLAFGPMRPVGLRDHAQANVHMQSFNYGRIIWRAVFIILWAFKRTSSFLNKNVCFGSFPGLETRSSCVTGRCTGIHS